MSVVLQYELWHECNCHCTFCTLGQENLKTKEEVKLKAINTATDEINNLKKGDHETIGFIGGEFFQGQLNTKLLFEKFCKMIDAVNNALNKNIINDFWLNVSLLIGKQEQLFEVLERIDKKDKIWLLTSYDTMGRFHTQKMFETWENSIFALQKKYPQINFNITSILTGDFITKYLNGELDLKMFREKYNSSLFLKNPVKAKDAIFETSKSINDKIGYFFPKRHDFLEFLKKYLKEEGIENYKKLISMDLRADEVRKMYNSGEIYNFTRNRKTLHEKEEGIDDKYDLVCGHNLNYASYCDSDKCILCDKQMILDMYGEY